MEARHTMFVWDYLKTDKSFQEKENIFTLLFGGISYKQHEVRNAYENAIKRGFELATDYWDENSRTEQLKDNSGNHNHDLFFRRFYRLCTEHNVRIQYRSDIGMCFEQLHPERPTMGHAGMIYAVRLKGGYTDVVESSKSLREKGIDELYFNKEFKEKMIKDESLFIYEVPELQENK